MTAGPVGDPSSRQAGSACGHTPGNWQPSSPGIFSEGIAGPSSDPPIGKTLSRRLSKWLNPPSKFVRRRELRRRHSSGNAQLAGQRPKFESASGKDVLVPFAQSGTSSEAVHSLNVPVSNTQTAFFGHPDLEATRQSLHTELQRLFGVQCILKALRVTDKSVLVNGVTLQVCCQVLLEVSMIMMQAV